MGFDAVSLGFALASLTLLASLPTDPYFDPWRDGPPSYRISAHSHPRHLPSAEGRSFPPYVVPPGSEWYLVDRGGPPDLREARGGVQNFPNSHSSHLNPEATIQRTGKAPKNVRENVDSVFARTFPGNAEESVNFDESSRNLRAENPKEVDVPNPRIVTPKGGRRPPQGSSAKNQNRPLNPGATNAISTTEKAFGNQTTKVPKKPRPGASKPQGGDIVFPDGFPKKFVPRLSKCAKRSTFCEHVGDEYPSDYINQVLKKDGVMFREFFGRDVISDPNITERINAPEENSLCPYRQEVVFPRAAQNKEDKWLFIINQDQYVQGVTVEVCLNPESRCILTEGFPLGYTPYCKQKYIERRLVAIGEDGKPHSDSFRLPSCCSCVVKHETSARMATLRSSGDLRRPTAP